MHDGSYREAPPSPPPARPPIMLALAIALGCLALALFTSNKLWTMAKLRGDVGGIPDQEMSIGREISRFGARVTVYELIDQQGGAWTIQADDAYSQELRSYQGLRIRVRCLERSRQCYVRGSVYIDDGNRQFDITLLAMELAGLIASVVLLRRRLKTWRQAQRLAAPPRA